MLTNPAAEQQAMRVVPAVISGAYLGTTRQRRLHEEVDKCGYRQDQDYRIPERVSDPAQDHESERKITPVTLQESPHDRTVTRQQTLV